jgi:intein-encoded DNA endonuclease-like protein
MTSALVLELLGRDDKRFYKPRLECSPELSYIVGVMLGDGCCQRGKLACWVALRVRDREFAEAFRDALVKIGLRPRFDVYSQGGKPLYFVRAVSKIFYTWWNSLSPDEVREVALRHPADFLRGFYDSEGSWTKDATVMYNNSLLVIQLVAEALKALGFRYSVGRRRYLTREGREPRVGYRIRILGGMSERRRFVEVVKPTIPRKSGYK